MNICYHGRGLESVSEDDVRVHCTHVKMIDDWIFQSSRSVSEVAKLFLDVTHNFLEVGHLEVKLKQFCQQHVKIQFFSPNQSKFNLLDSKYESKHVYLDS